MRHADRGAAAYRRVERDERSGRHERDSDAESGDRAALRTRSAVTGLEGQPALKQPSQSSVTPVSGHLSFVTTLSGLPRKEISEEVAAATSEVIFFGCHRNLRARLISKGNQSGIAMLHKWIASAECR